METAEEDRRREGCEKEELARGSDARMDCDEMLLEGVDALEQYLNEHERACAKLKQGFLKLTKARLRLPAHALGELSFHESFEAFRVASRGPDGRWQLQSAREAQLDRKGSNNQEEATLRQRTASSSTQKTNATGGDSSSPSTVNTSTEPLMWFSSLPPSDLRQAQKLFASGLEALLEAATSAQKVQKTVAQATNTPP